MSIGFQKFQNCRCGYHPCYSIIVFPGQEVERGRSGRRGNGDVSYIPEEEENIISADEVRDSFCIGNSVGRIYHLGGGRGGQNSCSVTSYHRHKIVRIFVLGHACDMLELRLE